MTTQFRRVITGGGISGNDAVPDSASEGYLTSGLILIISQYQ